MDHNNSKGSGTCGCTRMQRPAPPCMNTNCSCRQDISPVSGTCKPSMTTGTRGMQQSSMPAGSQGMQQPSMTAGTHGTQQPSMMTGSQGMQQFSRPPMMPNRPGGADSCPCGSLAIAMAPQMPVSLDTLPSMSCTMSGMPIGMGYVPWQRWNQTYPICQAFQQGTIFPELDMPFVMGRCR